MNRRSLLAAAALVLLLLSGACRTSYYAAWEKFGVYKRDLLKKKVIAARDDQKAAGEQFQDAFTRLQNLYGFNGGNLESTYRTLQKDYDRSTEKAERVRQRIQEMETVASDLFTEWEGELKQITSPSLQEASRNQLRATRTRYDTLHAALRKAEQSMDPVLTQFHDQVLYLKHNLNAQAIASLQGEATRIQTDISRLLAQMNASIAEADQFIKALP